MTTRGENRTRILTVVGTRPEVIKMAPVIEQLEAASDEFDSVVCSTGQHRELLDQAFDLFSITPDIELDLMLPDQRLSELSARLFESLDRVFAEVKPDWVLAQGDTTTVMVSSIVAFNQGIPFGHVEAGLRTGDLLRPFPEELNRRVADLTSRICFAPTEWARRNLENEAVAGRDIMVTGNTVIDALQEIAGRQVDIYEGSLSVLPRAGRRILVTAHRRENLGKPLRRICSAIRDLASEFVAEGVHFVYPVHPNPKVDETARSFLSELSNVYLVDPLDYLTFIHLMKGSYLILSDSGGVQEEAPSFGIPVLLMRETTERPEGVEAGVVRLVGTEREMIISATRELLQDDRVYARMATAINPYGDGRAAARIVTGLRGPR